jgi:DNA recombination protein RmuC
MWGFICGVAGLLVGAALTWAYSMKHAQSLRDGATQAKADLAVRESQLTAANEMLARERGEHENSLKNMELTFENMSNRVLANTVDQFNQSQEQVLKERDSKLDLTLKPLETLLDEYKKNLVDFNKEHAGALFDVKSRATELLQAQQKTQDETRRLNQLLGRGDQRGHWGEVQLGNVMEASGLRRNIDYDLQVSGVNDVGRALRPDCVVKMPNDASIAIDAKFPFDAFEAALATDDAEQRRLKHAEHATALRSHIKTLKEKSYWEVITPAPEFVVCFVPSDFAITAAFDADPQLHAFAAKERVLIVGPTNLLSLLWSVAMVLRQHDATLNAEEILKTAESMVDRIRYMVEPMAKMGKSLEDAVDSYNKMVKSAESRLIPAAQRMRGLGGAQRAKSLPELESVNEPVSQLNEGKWGVGPDNPLPEGISEILELEEFEGEL